MGKWGRLTVSLVLGLCALFTVLLPIINGVSERNISYVDQKLYGSTVNKYQQTGITSNAVYELFNGTIVDVFKDYKIEGIEDYVYKGGTLENSDYHGISEGNNLVYILVESFEWYVFLETCTKEQSLALYPNLNKFLEQSLYADNYYSREKTDTSEMLAILGSNPSDKYVNYDFVDNTLPYALPSMFRQSIEDNGNEVKQIKSFHQNTGSFYNREELHKSLGFDELIALEDMEDYGINGSLDGYSWKKGEMTPDSITMEKMQDEMFPLTEENEQYMTFWITYIMHGSYRYNENFEKMGYYDKLDEVGAYPAGKGTKSDYLRTYAAAVMDFDKAVGIMMDKLEANGQLDNTTIVMFADHNTYYHNLSAYAKNIDEKFNSELYRVPVMIYDNKLKEAYELDNGTRAISKFACGADLLPTILDIFGIEGYKNLYFGTSMFVEDVESVIYSRAYGIFVTDKLICYSIENLLYTCEGFTEEDKQDFIERATEQLTKLEYMDKIFYNDYFKHHVYMPPSVS